MHRLWFPTPGFPWKTITRAGEENRMSYYIVCHKKRNNPRVNIQICQKKCTEKEDCKEYISCTRTAIQREDITPPPNGQPVTLEAA